MSGAGGDTVSDAVTAVLWPSDRAGEALIAIAQAAGLAPRAAELGDAPRDPACLDAWLDAAASWIGVELEAASAPYEMLATALAACAPALIRTDAGVLVVVASRRRRLIVLDAALRRRELAIDEVVARMSRAATEAARPDVHALLDRAGLRDRDRAAHALIAARLRGQPIDGVMLVRRPPDAPARSHARDQRLIPRMIGVLALHALAQAMWLGSWWAMGKSVLAGGVSTGWLGAWALLLGSAQLARLGVGWWSGRVGIDGAALLAQRLLAGALRLDPDRLKHDGVGGALGRVLESAALQNLAIGGGVAAALAAVELALALVVLALGAGGAVHALSLIGVLALVALATRGYLRARRAWTAERLALTHDLTEAMSGHATRLAQADLARLAERDDRAQVRYLSVSRAVDRAQRRLAVVIPLAWPIAAALGLAPALVFDAPSVGAVAAALGGVLFAADALGRLTSGAARLADAAIAWRAIEALFAAAADRPDVAPPGLALAAPSTSAPVLGAKAIGYRHAGRGAPVLADCDLVIARGERVLLDAPSGRGKSTFAAILAGLRRPDSGLVLAGGLDRASVGADGWRRRVAYAPQFHDNHVFGGSLIFNVLMGRAWPPTPADVALADEVCRELGLGPLIDRMPAGLMEQVGETGWQLSHGERSRVFLARALLQDAALVVLDESLAALDPANLAIAVRCIEARATAAIVIAHP